MATTPTNNPVPSESPIDLKYNAGKIDEFVSSFAEWYVDRFGNKHYTIEGLKQLVLQQIYNLGWNPVGTFQGGAQLTAAGDIIQDTSTGIWYRWDGLSSLPKNVPAGSTPGSTGGTGEGKWLTVDVTDILRQQLADGDGSLVGLGGGKTVADLGKTGGASLVVAADDRNVDQWLVALDTAEYRSLNIRNLTSAQYKCRRKQAIKIVCQGDSMTAGYDVSSTDIIPAGEGGDPETHATINYPKRLQSYLTEQSGIPVTVTTQARSGTTAKDGYTLFPSNPACDLAFIMYGINDASGAHGATHAEYLQYMELLVRRFIKWGHGVVVMTCASGGQGSADPLYQMYAQEVKNLASIYGCAHMDAHEVVYNIQSGIVQSDFTHFNSAGYSRLGEAVASMIMAGGLMPNYKPVTSEHHTWPGRQSDSIGYYDAKGNLNTLYSADIGSLQQLRGAMPPNVPVLISFSFYLDAEAAEIDITGRWADNQVRMIVSQSVPSGTTTRPGYYDINEVRASTWVNNKAQSTSSALYLRNRSGTRFYDLPRRAGCIVGRGWKTITLFTDLNSGAALTNYIEGLTIRPVPVAIAQQNINPSRAVIGVVEAYTQRIPFRDVADAATTPPSPVALTTAAFPLPAALYGSSFNNGTDWFDAGVVEITIRSVGGTANTGVMRAILSKAASGADLVVTELSRSNADLPNISRAYIAYKPRDTLYAAGSVATNMPTRDIYQPGVAVDGVAPASGTPAMGNNLGLVFTYPNTSKTAFWTIDIKSIAPGGGGAVASAF